MSVIKLRDAKMIAKGWGIHLDKSGIDGEYRVTVITKDAAHAERIAYYTDDLQDALETAKRISMFTLHTEVK